MRMGKFKRRRDDRQFLAHATAVPGEFIFKRISKFTSHHPSGLWLRTGTFPYGGFHTYHFHREVGP